METISVCPYCGCGCKLVYVSDGKRVTKIKPCKNDEVSEGKPCIKGLTLNEVSDKSRILSPMIRSNNKLVKVSWKRALSYIKNNLKKLSPDEIMVLGSGKITNEDNYVIQKFARVCLKTSNIDSCCTRLCHAGTVKAMKDCFGTPNLTKLSYLDKIDTLLVVGSNPLINYPVMFNKIVDKKVNLVSIQYWDNDTSMKSYFKLNIKPGTEIILINGLINKIIKSGAKKKNYSYNGFEVLKQYVKNFTQSYVTEQCKISRKDFEKVYKIIIDSKSIGVCHGMGLTQHVNSTEDVHSLLNLAILLGAKILTMRGEVNVQGVGDMGLVPDALPSGAFVNVDKLNRLWNTKISIAHGKTLMEGLILNPVKATILTHFNPAQSLPSLSIVHKNLKKMFLVSINSYLDLTSKKFADVVLPSPALFERTGTITNGERRVRSVQPAISPKGKAKPEWKIFCELARLFNVQGFDYRNEKDIFKEIVKVIPDYSDLKPNKIYDGYDGWPNKVPLYTTYIPEQFEGVDEVVSRIYPLLLTTYRSRYKFLTGEMTSLSPTLKRLDKAKPGFFINPETAAKYGLKNNTKVKVTSSVSSLTGYLYFNKNLPKGLVGANFHSEQLLVNKLFPLKFDEQTFTPNYKLIAVNIKPV